MSTREPRLSPRQRGYDSKWAAYAKNWLILFPYCGMRNDGYQHTEHSICTQQGRITVRAQCVDHIVALVDGGEKMDPSNHQSLCNRCNVQKAATSRKGKQPSWG